MSLSLGSSRIRVMLASAMAMAVPTIAITSRPEVESMKKAAMPARTRWFPKVSRNTPHQGKKEIARRLRTKLESKPRRKWVIVCQRFGANFGTYESSKRAPLARLHFARWCPITLRDGGAA